MVKIFSAQALRRVSYYLIFGLVISAVSLFAFAELADEIRDEGLLVRFDIALANALHDQIQPTNVPFWVIVSLFGFQILYVLCALLGIGLAVRRQWVDLGLWLATLLGGVLLNQLLKGWFVRARPTFDVPLVSEANFSFPSGHAMLSLIAYGFAAYLIIQQVGSPIPRILTVFVAVMAIVLIGISRLYLGAHYLSDVIGGYSAGLVWLATCITAREYLQRRSRTRQAITPDEQPARGVDAPEPQKVEM